MRNALKIALIGLAVSGSLLAVWGATPKGLEMSRRTETPNRGRIDAENAVHVPAFTLPFSNLASPEAKAWLADRASHPLPTSAAVTDVQALRKAVDAGVNLPMLTKQRVRYAVTTEPRTIGGVYTEVFTPNDGVNPKNKKRVLINLHGGGFIVGARTLGAVESIPIASVGKITVNCVAPGMINTPAGEAARRPGMPEALAPMIPLKPLGKPEDLVGTLLYLVSDASAWVTGQIIRVDGGWIKRVT